MDCAKHSTNRADDDGKRFVGCGSKTERERMKRVSCFARIRDSTFRPLPHNRQTKNASDLPRYTNLDIQLRHGAPSWMERQRDKNRGMWLLPPLRRSELSTKASTVCFTSLHLKFTTGSEIALSY
eukprot:scaffold1893_cov220-Amphora_coffeaeformis.AAC.4